MCGFTTKKGAPLCPTRKIHKPKSKTNYYENILNYYQ